MIPQSAIKAYLKRPLDDHSWIKTKSNNKLRFLLRKFEALNPQLRQHQRACFLLGTAYPKFAFWLDMGTGKTLITLELLRHWWQLGMVRRALVFITSDVAFPTWEKQIKRFGIDLPYRLLEGSSVQKWQQLEQFDEGILFINYAGAVALTSVPVLKKNKKTEWVLDPTAVRVFGNAIDAVVLDESTRAAGYTSLTYKLINALKAPVRYALAGRPFGRDPTMLWAQHYLIDRGATLTKRRVLVFIC